MAIAGAQLTGRASEIFTQEGRKVGRYLGFASQSQTPDATAPLDGRCEVMSRTFNDCSHDVIGACIEVHRELGPGLLEGIYEECLCHELTLRGLAFERQKPLVVAYKGAELEQRYRVDLIIERSLLMEIKAVDALLPIHSAQLITYLRISRLEHGLLVNFNAETIRGGLRRLSRTPPLLPTFRPSCKKISLGPSELNVAGRTQ